MTLFIEPTTEEFTRRVQDDLLKIVNNDPGLAIDELTPDGHEVTFTPASNDLPVGPEVYQVELNNVLTTIINSEVKTWIRGRASDFSLRSPSPTGVVDLKEHGGNTAKDDYPGTTEVRIDYDVEGCDGRGYQKVNPDGEVIDVPREAMLVNELGHAYAFCTTGRSTGSEEERRVLSEGERDAESERIENLYRSARELDQRIGSTGLRCTPQEGGGPNCSSCADCFIATAAYGSASESEVELLRFFRDEILPRTHSGDSFARQLRQYYDKIGPPLAAYIETDEVLKNIVRWAVVDPITNYVRLSLALPDAPLDDVPEPWKSFLADLVHRSENWSRTVHERVDLETLSPREAAQEIAFVLKHVLRRPESRDEYLSRLESQQRIPLKMNSPTAEEVVAILRDSGRPDRDIQRIVGTCPLPSGGLS